MSKKFTATLSVSSIRKLQNDLKKYKSNLYAKAEQFARELADESVEIAKMKISTFDAIFTGELQDSIHSEEKQKEKNKVIFAVVAGTDHALFVEFGTGQMGLDKPYPYELPEGVSWSYATGQTIRQNALGRYYWFYPDDDGKWHYTEGMPSRPFMYETANDLKQKVEEVAKRVFANS